MPQTVAGGVIKSCAAASLAILNPGCSPEQKWSVPAIADESSVAQSEAPSASDMKTTREGLTERFGAPLCDLVLEVTDDKKLDKLERKRLQVLKAPTKSPGAKIIKIADKISNLRNLKASPPD